MPRELTFKPTYKAGEIIELPAADIVIPDEKEDPLFDIRSQAEADAALTSDIKKKGFRSTPWVVEREKGVLTIVAGRRRVKAAQAAKVNVTVYIVDPTSDDFDLVSDMITENERRLGDNVINRARKADRLFSLGLERFRPVGVEAVTQDENGEVQYNGEGWRPSKEQKREVWNLVADSLGVTVKRVRDQMVPLLSMSPKCVKAIENNKIAESVVFAWRDKTHERQDVLLEAALEKMKGNGGGKVKGKGRTKKDGKYPKVFFTREDLEAIRDAPEDVPANVQAFLDVHLTYTDITAGPKWMRDMFVEEVEAAEEAAEEEE